jgi:hypothetical protein
LGGLFSSVNAGKYTEIKSEAILLAKNKKNDKAEEEKNAAAFAAAKAAEKKVVIEPNKSNLPNSSSASYSSNTLGSPPLAANGPGKFINKENTAKKARVSPPSETSPVINSAANNKSKKIEIVYPNQKLPPKANLSENTKKLYSDILEKLKLIQEKMAIFFKNRLKERLAFDRELIKSSKSGLRKQEPKLQDIADITFKSLINLFLIIEKLRNTTGKYDDINEDIKQYLKNLIKEFTYKKKENEKVSNKNFLEELRKLSDEIFHQTKTESIKYFNKNFKYFIDNYWDDDNSKPEILELKNNNN